MKPTGLSSTLYGPSIHTQFCYIIQQSFRKLWFSVLHRLPNLDIFPRGIFLKALCDGFNDKCPPPKAQLFEPLVPGSWHCLGRVAQLCWRKCITGDEFCKRLNSPHFQLTPSELCSAFVVDDIIHPSASCSSYHIRPFAAPFSYTDGLFSLWNRKTKSILSSLSHLAHGVSLQQHSSN